MNLTQSNEINASLSQETEQEGKCFIQDKRTINLVQILQSFEQGNHKNKRQTVHSTKLVVLLLNHFYVSKTKYI